MSGREFYSYMIQMIALLVLVKQPRWEIALVIVAFVASDIVTATIAKQKDTKATDSEIDELRAEIKETKAKTNQLSLKLGFKQ